MYTYIYIYRERERYPGVAARLNLDLARCLFEDLESPRVPGPALLDLALGNIRTHTYISIYIYMYVCIERDI